MNALIPAAVPLTMTSLEIADLVEARHDNVKVTIERLAGRGVITLPSLQEVSNPGPGPRMIEVYRFSGEQGKRDSIVVVAQLSPGFTARLVDRWQELEAAVAGPRVPLDFAEALRLAANQQEQLQQQATAIAVLAPKAAALDRMSAGPGEQTLTEVAKGLTTSRDAMIDWMLREGLLYRLGNVPSGRLMAMQTFIDRGLLAMRERYNENSGRMLPEVRVTAAGITWLGEHLPPELGGKGKLRKRRKATQPAPPSAR